ncbi:MAG TPA: hypothetical protein VHE61_01295 [Opitutaceae bacterium]|nr:hypothetical protein [Opitutaceae bacterium]
MKTYRPFLLVVLAFGIAGLFTAGCANTAAGVRADTHNAAEHVENATR